MPINKPETNSLGSPRCTIPAIMAIIMHTSARVLQIFLALIKSRVEFGDEFRDKVFGVACLDKFHSNASSLISNCGSPLNR